MTGKSERNAKRTGETNLQKYHTGKFYRLCLSGSPHLDYINSELCAMLGYERQEIEDLFQNQYEKLIHSEDVEKYRNFLTLMRTKETSVMIEYRLITKMGESLFVSDTMTSRKFEDGSWKAFSAVTDITDLKTSYDIMETANNVVSCGILRFTCEKYPKVLFMNDGMKKLLGGGTICSEMFLEDVRNNIYFMLPFEEKNRFRRYLEAADTNKGNVNFKISIYQVNGDQKPVIGWIRKVKTETQNEYEGFFLDSEACTTDERAALRRDFVSALASVYETVFEVDLRERTIKCLHASNPTAKKAMTGVRMLLKDAVEYWSEKVYPVSLREECKAFFSDIQRGLGGDTPRRLVFGLQNRFGNENIGGGVPLKRMSNIITEHIFCLVI